MNTKAGFALVVLAGIALVWIAEPVGAGYKARTWNVGARDSYRASLTSEGVTIAVEPLFTDALASRVFDKEDIVTRGIVPLAILIFNDNDFPVRVDGLSIELIHGEERMRTLLPSEVVYQLFKKSKSWIQPASGNMGFKLNRDAFDDFDGKFLREKTVAPHSKDGGFLYMHVRDSGDRIPDLSNSVVYIPKVYRQDDGSRLIFFEIELKAAVSSAPRY